MSRAKRYPRVPNNNHEPYYSGRGRLQRFGAYGAILTTVVTPTHELQLHATKGFRKYRRLPDSLMAGVVRGT